MKVWLPRHKLSMSTVTNKKHARMHVRTHTHTHAHKLICQLVATMPVSHAIPWWTQRSPGSSPWAGLCRSHWGRTCSGPPWSRPGCRSLPAWWAVCGGPSRLSHDHRSCTHLSGSWSHQTAPCHTHWWTSETCHRWVDRLSLSHYIRSSAAK